MPKETFKTYAIIMQNQSRTNDVSTLSFQWIREHQNKLRMEKEKYLILNYLRNVRIYRQEFPQQKSFETRKSNLAVKFIPW